MMLNRTIHETAKAMAVVLALTVAPAFAGESTSGKSEKISARGAEMRDRADDIRQEGKVPQAKKMERESDALERRAVEIESNQWPPSEVLPASPASSSRSSSSRSSSSRGVMRDPGAADDAGSGDDAAMDEAPADDEMGDEEAAEDEGLE